MHAPSYHDIFTFMQIEAGKRSSRTGRGEADKTVVAQLREGGMVAGRRDFNRDHCEPLNRPVIGSSLPEALKARALRVAAVFGLS